MYDVMFGLNGSYGGAWLALLRYWGGVWCLWMPCLYSNSKAGLKQVQTSVIFTFCRSWLMNTTLTYCCVKNCNETRLPFIQRWTSHKCAYLISLVYSLSVPVTLTLTLTLTQRPWHMKLDILKKYLYTRNELCRSELARFRDTQTYHSKRSTTAIFVGGKMQTIAIEADVEWCYVCWYYLFLTDLLGEIRCINKQGVQWLWKENKTPRVSKSLA